jgi:hypothetical protein
MRTKTLLIAAAALAAGVITSQAQPVYSQNIVGYVNTTLPPSAYSLVEAPLNLDGTNTADNVLTCLQAGDNLLLWSGTSFLVYQYFGLGVGFNWQYPDGSYHTTGPVIPPGTGFFYQNGSTSNETNTFVGSVVLTNFVNFPASEYSVIGSTPSIAFQADGTNSPLPLQAGDNVLLWNAGTQSFLEYQYYGLGVGFNWQYPDGSYQTTGPTVPVGSAFFYQNGSTAAETWTNTFTVQ